MYWGILYSAPFESTYDLWSNVSVHACNSAYALFEVLFTCTEPLPWWHLAPVIVVLGSYLGLAYLTHATQNRWVYGFLDDKNGTQRGKVAGYCVGIFVAAVVIHFLVHWIIWLRIWIVEKKLGLLAKQSKKDISMVRPVCGDLELAENSYHAK